jgi:hypothetical protein
MRDAFDHLEERLNNRMLKADGEKDRLDEALGKTQA